MSSPQNGFADVVKDVFYKFCFCLGLGTASYYSYAQVQTWVSPASSAPTAVAANTSAPTSFMQDKLNTLEKTPEGAAVLARAVSPTSEHATLFRPMQAQVVAPVMTAAPDTILASASPSPSPGASPGASPSEATAAASPAANGDTAAAPVATVDANGNTIYVDSSGNQVAPPGVEVTSAPGIAYQPQMEYPINPQFQTQSAQATAPAVDTPNVGEAPATSAFAGTTSLGVAGSAGAAGTSGNATSTANTATGTSTASTSTSTSHDTPTTGYTPATTGGTSVSSLSSTEINWITGTTLKAAFSNTQESVSGLYCNQGSSSGGCAQQSRIPMYPNRWGTAEGLETAATLTMKASSNALVEFDLSFKLQNAQLTEQSVVLSIPASSVSVQTSTSNGITYKTYNFTLPNTTALGQNQLMQMEASLVYQINGSGTGSSATLMNTSTFSFVRNKVTTVEQSWDPTSASRSPAATAPYIIAESVQYSINLQKQ